MGPISACKDGVGSARAVALIYLGWSLVWIWTTDAAVARLGADDLVGLQIVKGTGFVIVTAALLWWLIRRDETRLIAKSDDLEAANRSLRALHVRLADLDEDQRKRIADAVHDGPVQGLVATSMRLELLARGASNGSGPSPADLSGIAEDVRATLDQIRVAMADLDPFEKCAERGLEEGLRGLARTAAPGVDLTLESEGDCTWVPGEVCYSLLRVAAGALRNAVRHSRAEAVAIVTVIAADEVVMTITDDGVGFDVSAPLVPGQIGLAAMRSHAAMVRGDLTVRSGKAGTRVTLRAPFGSEKSRRWDGEASRCDRCSWQPAVESPREKPLKGSKGTQR